MLIPPDQHPVCVQFYVSRSDKRAFQQACRLTDTTMSREFRRFMRWYLKSTSIAGDRPRLPTSAEVE